MIRISGPRVLLACVLASGSFLVLHVSFRDPGILPEGSRPLVEIERPAPGMQQQGVAQAEDRGDHSVDLLELPEEAALHDLLGGAALEFDTDLLDRLARAHRMAIDSRIGVRTRAQLRSIALDSRRTQAVRVFAAVTVLLATRDATERTPLLELLQNEQDAVACWTAIAFGLEAIDAGEAEEFWLGALLSGPGRVLAPGYMDSWRRAHRLTGTGTRSGALPCDRFYEVLGPIPPHATEAALTFVLSPRQEMARLYVLNQLDAEDQTVLESLSSLAAQPVPVLKWNAINAIRFSGHPNTSEWLARFFDQERDPYNRAYLAALLVEEDHPVSYDLAARVIADPAIEPGKREELLYNLAASDTNGALDLLRRIRPRLDASERATLYRSLSSSKHPESVEILLEGVGEPDDLPRSCALRSLYSVSPDDARDLVATMRGIDPTTRFGAVASAIRDSSR